MAELFTLRVVTPERVFCDEPVKMAELVTTEGQIGIYAGHAPTAAVVSPGILKIHWQDKVREASLMAGFIQILPETVTILAEAAEWPEEIKKAVIICRRRIFTVNHHAPAGGFSQQYE